MIVIAVILILWAVYDCIPKEDRTDTSVRMDYKIKDK